MVSQDYKEPIPKSMMKWPAGDGKWLVVDDLHIIPMAIFRGKLLDCLNSNMPISTIGIGV